MSPHDESFHQEAYYERHKREGGFEDISPIEVRTVRTLI